MFPLIAWWFSIVMLVYQRVSPSCMHTYLEWVYFSCGHPSSSLGTGHPKNRGGRVFPALWQGWSPVILIGAIPTLDTAPYRFWKNRNSWQKSMTQWLSCAEGFLSCFSLACYVLIRKHWTLHEFARTGGEALNLLRWRWRFHYGHRAL